MKLDVTAMRYLTKEHFRVLTAVEMGMKNHEIVPTELIASIAKLRSGGIQKILSHLLRNQLIAHDGMDYDGFRLTYSGYDFLALKTFLNRNKINAVGRQIGIGKESDIFIAIQEDGTEVAIKFHRLGRTSFRAVKNKRDYLNKRKTSNWLYMSRLSALKEFAFLKALYDRGFPTPVPIDYSRHAICMSLIDGYPLNQVRKLANSKDVYDAAMSLVVRLANCGLVHCDFNEFNLMIDKTGKLTLIDFPQMISTSHPNAAELFERDVNGLVKFFSRLQGGAYVPDHVPALNKIMIASQDRLDIQVEASGFDGEAIIFEEPSSDESYSEEEDCGDSNVEENVLDEETNTEIPPTLESLSLRDQFQDVKLDLCDTQPVDQLIEHVRSKIREEFSHRKSTRPRSRNQSKLSIKGRLVHKSSEY